MDYEKKLIPENDMQELWELHGRVYAALEYIKGEQFLSRDILTAMLGGDVKELNRTRETAGDVNGLSLPDGD